MTHKIKLFSAICFLLTLVSVDAVQFTYPPGGTGGGAGSVISNQTSTAVIATFYTNTTPHYVLGEARLGVSTIGTLQCSVTNSDNTLYFQYQAEQLSVGATSNTISFTVPPGGWYKFIGLTTTATDGSQKLLYIATNGSVSFAINAGSAGSVTGTGAIVSSDFNGNGANITNQQSMLAMLENMPRGRSRSPGSYTELGGNVGDLTICSSGQGVLRSLFCMLDTGSTGSLDVNINKLELVIVTDGVITGRAYVSDLLNCTYRFGTTGWEVINRTKWLRSHATGLSIESGFPLYNFEILAPMPFGTSIRAFITNSTASSSLWTHGYFQAQYELTTLPPELASARTYITNIHRTSWSGTASNFIFSISGQAEIIGVQLGISNRTVSTTSGFQADKGIAYYPDQYKYTWDLDDWFGQTYGGAFGERVFYDVGHPHNTYDPANDGIPGSQEMYRWLGADALRCTNSMDIYTDNGQAVDAVYFTYIYIRKP